MENARIEQVDKNFVVQTELGEPDLVFYDVRKDPFEIYGLYSPRTEPQFKRLPDEIGKNVNAGVASLYLNTAGGRVRFSTDSEYVAISARMPSIGRMPHITLAGSAGFDLYLDEPESGVSRFCRPFMPKYDMQDGYESVIHFGSRKLRHFTICFPSYSQVSELFVGLQKDASLGKGVPYRSIAPMVYYGSSITQGGCSSRPGNIYQNIICRRLGIDYLNLGFSGSGRAEDLIVDYMTGLDMSVFISDYDHNAPNVGYLAETHCKMYQKIRAAKPDVPYVMLSRPDFDTHYFDSVKRRNVVVDTFHYARAQGDRNVYLIDGEGIFRGLYRDMCTVDGCHPNDLGFAMMADAIESELRIVLTQPLVDR